MYQSFFFFILLIFKRRKAEKKGWLINQMANRRTETGNRTSSRCGKSSKRFMRDTQYQCFYYFGISRVKIKRDSSICRTLLYIHGDGGIHSTNKFFDQSLTCCLTISNLYNFVWPAESLNAYFTSPRNRIILYASCKCFAACCALFYIDCKM